MHPMWSRRMMVMGSRRPWRTHWPTSDISLTHPPWSSPIPWSWWRSISPIVPGQHRTGLGQELGQAVVECSLLGHLQCDHRACPHHDLRCSLLGNPHQALSIHCQQLVSCLQAPILPGRTSLHHGLDVDAEPFLAHPLSSHYRQPHPIGLGQADGLYVRLLWQV